MVYKKMVEIIFKKIKKYQNKIVILAIVFAFLDLVLFARIFASGNNNDDFSLYFLNVGQGDSSLAILPGGVKMLLDGGPATRALVNELARILPPTDRYIDVVVLSHQQLDHFGGFIELFKRYRVGIFLWNGRDGEIKAFADLKKLIARDNISTVVIRRGDRIRYGESVANVIWPTKKIITSKELNDTSIVMNLTSKNTETLFTGDIGFKIEDQLIRDMVFSRGVDILKIPHHGSKFSTGENFLAALQPKVAAIGVGKNSYGHPTRAVLDRLEKYGVRTYRTDRDGTLKLVIDGKSMRIFTAKKQR